MKIIKKIISLLVVMSIVSSFLMNHMSIEASPYECTYMVLSENGPLDHDIIKDAYGNTAKLQIESIEDFNDKHLMTDIVIDLSGDTKKEIADIINDCFQNKIKVYICGGDQNTSTAYATNAIEMYYNTIDSECEIELVKEYDNFIGCSLEIIDTNQTVLTYYFGDKYNDLSNRISMMMQADSADLVYDSIEKDTGIAQLEVYSVDSYYRVVPTIVNESNGSEMQSIFYFERIAEGKSETLWDVNNVINLTPKGGYQTHFAHVWLNVSSSSGERLIGFGPTATVNSSSTNYTVSGTITSNGGGSVGASRSYSVSLADIQCTPEYLSSSGESHWLYEYKAGTTAAKGSSVLSSTIRVANNSGPIVIYPATNYIVAETYWFFGTHYGTSSALYLEEELPELKISFNDIK